MTNLTSVHVTAGVPDTGTGDVSTNDAVIAAITAGLVSTGSQAAPSTSYLSSVVAGDIAHDGVDSGNPVLQGRRTIAHGTNPTAVAAADRSVLYANRAGIPFMIGGHPNIIRRSHVFADADNAQTNAALVTISTGLKIVLTHISCKADSTNTVGVAVRIGFGTASVPAASTAGTVGIVLEGVIAAGGELAAGNGSGIIAVGADNEDLRITSDDPTTGAIHVTYSYYTIES